MITSRKSAGVLATLMVVGALAFAGSAAAKEGSSGNGKTRIPPPPPVSTSCVEGPAATAWAGLTLSPWNATNADTGETWTFSFDDKGGVKYTRGGGPVVRGFYVQPLTVFDASHVLVLSSPGAVLGSTVPFVVPHSTCTMTWYTSDGPLDMVRT
jgi:hypothetical protein